MVLREARAGSGLLCPLLHCRPASGQALQAQPRGSRRREGCGVLRGACESRHKEAGVLGGETEAERALLLPEATRKSAVELWQGRRQPKSSGPCPPLRGGQH